MRGVVIAPLRTNYSPERINLVIAGAYSIRLLGFFSQTIGSLAFTFRVHVLREYSKS